MEVVGSCACGCPSIDFAEAPTGGIRPRVDAGVRGTAEQLFLFTVADGRLGGIEYVSSSDEMAAELPDPALLDVWFSSGD